MPHCWGQLLRHAVCMRLAAVPFQLVLISACAFAGLAGFRCCCSQLLIACACLPSCAGRSVYFTVQASHLSYLAAKLGAAVDEAMSIPDQRPVAMICEALARRFPSDMMMSKYRELWQQVRGFMGLGWDPAAVTDNPW